MALAKIERELAARGEGCLGKAADNEPVFILRAKDRFAPDLISLWASKVEAAAKAEDRLSTGRELKIAEARSLAAQAFDWQVLNGCKIPD